MTFSSIRILRAVFQLLGELSSLRGSALVHDYRLFTDKSIVRIGICEKNPRDPAGRGAVPTLSNIEAGYSAPVFDKVAGEEPSANLDRAVDVPDDIRRDATAIQEIVGNPLGDLHELLEELVAA